VFGDKRFNCPMRMNDEKMINCDNNQINFRTCFCLVFSRMKTYYVRN
jgi:hypothetical protein